MRYPEDYGEKVEGLSFFFSPSLSLFLGFLFIFSPFSCNLFPCIFFHFASVFVFFFRPIPNTFILTFPSPFFPVLFFTLVSFHRHKIPFFTLFSFLLVLGLHFSLPPPPLSLLFPDVFNHILHSELRFLFFIHRKTETDREADTQEHKE